MGKQRRARGAVRLLSKLSFSLGLTLPGATESTVSSSATAWSLHSRTIIISALLQPQNKIYLFPECLFPFIFFLSHDNLAQKKGGEGEKSWYRAFIEIWNAVLVWKNKVSLISKVSTWDFNESHLVVLPITFHYESLWAICWLGMKTPTLGMGQWAHPVPELSSQIVKSVSKRKSRVFIFWWICWGSRRAWIKHKTFSAA